MRAVIMSDSHGDLASCSRAVEMSARPELVVHLGDHYSDMEDLKSLFPDTKIVGVLGNCDYGFAKCEDTAEFGGVKIYFTHGHIHSDEEIARRAKAKGCAFAFRGHTHVPSDKVIDGVRVMNPGSVSRPRGGSKPSFILLESENGKIEATLVDWLSPVAA